MVFRYTCISKTTSSARAAKLGLLNFLSLFPSVGGGVVAEFFRQLLEPTPFQWGGGSSGIFPSSPVAHVYPIFVGIQAHSLLKYDQNSHFFREELFCIQIPSIPGGFFTIPGDLEITRHFWRLPEIPGDLAGLALLRCQLIARRTAISGAM